MWQAKAKAKACYIVVTAAHLMEECPPEKMMSREEVTFVVGSFIPVKLIDF